MNKILQVKRFMYRFVKDRILALTSGHPIVIKESSYSSNVNSTFRLRWNYSERNK